MVRITLGPPKILNAVCQKIQLTNRTSELFFEVRVHIGQVADMSIRAGAATRALVIGADPRGDLPFVERELAAIADATQVRTTLNRLLRLMLDAETGARGYLLTGDPRYLQPYDTAVGEAEATAASKQDAETKAAEEFMKRFG